MTRHPLVDQVFALSRAGRRAESLALLCQVADAGDPEALFLLAEVHWVGGPVPQDFRQGRALFERAAEAGHALAGYGVTNLLGSGIAGRRDWPEALRRLQGEARTDPARAAMLAIIEKMTLDAEGDPCGGPAADVLSEAPRIRRYSAAATEAECVYLRALAEPHFAPSMVGDGRGREIRDPVRNSDGASIHWLIEDPVVHALNRRFARLSGSRAEDGEALQILRYRPGEQYRPHVDWDGGDNGRILTALLYLNDDYRGGATRFVKTGLEIAGRIGDLLVFHNGTPEGRFDPMAEHAGLPVTEGTKYLASRWIHERRYAA